MKECGADVRERTGFLWRHTGRQAWGVVMLVVTALYLAVEFGFNARLLDVVGGHVSTQDVDAIERWGRCLSGFAVALAFWPTYFKNAHKRHWRTDQLMGLLVIHTLLVMFLVFHLEKVIIIDQMVYRSTATERAQAVNLQLLQQAVMHGDSQLDGMPLTPATAPDVKTFLAVFPYLAVSIPHLGDSFQTHKADLIRRAMDRQAPQGLEQGWAAYQRSLKTLQGQYNQYANGSNQASSKLAHIDTDVDQQWQVYANGLAAHGWTPDSVPRAYWGRVRQSVRNKGLRVANDWAPSDRQGFYDAYRQRVEAVAGHGLTVGAGVHLPLGLSFAQFLARPEIQKGWKQALGLPLTETRPLQAFSTEEAFRTAVYEPQMERHVADLLGHLNAPPEAFAEHGVYAQEGREAYRAIVVPPISLALSLLGAFVHILKLALWIGMVATGWTYRNFGVLVLWVAGLGGGVLAGVSMAPTTTITTAPMFTHTIYPAAQADGWAGPVQAWLMRATIHLQPVAWPAFEWVRVHVLQDASFGVRTAEVPPTPLP